ncbi:MAG: sugar phosphate isomerase/epimerase family protein [Pirellulaceae bacterium]
MTSVPLGTTRFQPNRRQLLGLGAGFCLHRWPMVAPQVSRATESLSDPFPICVFAKPFQRMEVQSLAELIGGWPVAGIEATVRQGGQVEPAEASEKLPRLLEALRARDRHFHILTTDIQRGDHPDVGRVLEVAAKEGVKYFRMAYYKYDLSQPLLPQLEQFAGQARSLADVCKDLGMTALYQNHAGSGYVGAPVLDLLEVFCDLPVQQIALALDLRHTTVEATSSWETIYARMKERIGAIFLKDAVVERGEARDVPLGEGPHVQAFFRKVLRDGVKVPLSLHMEHIDHQPDRLLPDRIDATVRDFATLQQWLQNR